MYFYNYYDYCTAKCLDPFDLKINVSTANISMFTILLATVNNNHLLTGLTCLILFTQQDSLKSPHYYLCCWRSGVDESVSLKSHSRCPSSFLIYFLWNLFFLCLLPAPFAAFSATICWNFFLLFCLNSASASSSSTMFLFLSPLGIREW